MPKKKTKREKIFASITIDEMKKYIKDGLDGKDDISISRIYETMSGNTVVQKGKGEGECLRLIT